jgi:hypothetical protein
LYYGPSWNKEIIDDSLGNASFLKVGDMDGDNDLDVVAAGSQAGDVVWYDYEAPSWNKHYIVSNMGWPYDFDVANINGDNDLDVIVPDNDNIYNDVIWFENDALSWPRHDIDTNFYVVSVRAADIDGDNDLDVVAIGEKLVWYENVIVGIEEEPTAIPSGYNLSQNYPNPFNPATTIEFSLPQSGFVTLKIYNILGEEVATLVYKYNWDARGLASGVYLYRVETDNFVHTRKMLLIR